MNDKNPKGPTFEFDNLSFEDALSHLDNTVQTLETGGMSLDEATRLYENGMRLARLCSKHLASTELKITQIQTAYGEQINHLPEEQFGSDDTS